MATYIARKGVRAEHVSAMLGHGIIGNKTTSLYIHYQPSYLSDAKLAIEEYMHDLQNVVKSTDILHCSDVLLSKCSQMAPSTIERKRWVKIRKRV